jgi:polyphosphate kinase
VREKMLDTYLKDNTRARVMQADGTYKRLKSPDDHKVIDVQEIFMNDSRHFH